ncbi:epithelial cell adhesion molecule [Pristis pectinata]|uniref:epithelial cell adhesion molecule n=1 Tax=Pristis pectinata TaxID=685728 RepID=UPI00223E3725|nr:epithelial cell adhesion molecule [Pristis pectinata]
MRVLGSLVLALCSLAALAQEEDKDCPMCLTNQFAKCSGSTCECTLKVAENMAPIVNCSKLTSKCWMMKNEMYRKKNNIGTRRKPTEHAMLDNDGIYDPECNNEGKFHAKQCNGTDTCWCVNTAGVRRTDKGDVNIQCPELVETFWFQVQLRHKPMEKQVDQTKLKEAIKNVFAGYQVDPGYIENVEYSEEDHYIIVDLKQNRTVTSPTDLATATYYLEKDIKGNTLFSIQYNRSIQDDGIPFDGTKLSFEEAYVYYIDSKNPEFSMKGMTPGIIAVIVVVCLAVVAGLVVLFFTRRKAAKSHIYQKAEGRELDEIQKQQLTT